MKNITRINNCYGCGVCSASCPKNVISILLNKDGFYEPSILDSSNCVECGICLDVCAFNHENRSLENDEISIKSWAAWSNDEAVRRKCSSGGIGFEIGKQLIEGGYQAVGCRYDITKQRAEHYIATTVEELVQSIGSKYIQSYTEEAFKQINRKGQKYLVTGTPCQIDSFRRMIRLFHCEDNFILMDFFCHGVPSMHAWKAYLKMLKPQIGEVTCASWRNKFEYKWHVALSMGADDTNATKPINWHDSYNLILKGEKTSIQSGLSQGDLFYKLFLGDLVVGPQCQHNCKYKYDKSSADIRIGDFWGNTYKGDEKGTSALIAFTELGQKVIADLQNVTLVEHPFQIVAEGQMKTNSKAAPLHDFMIKVLADKGTIDSHTQKLISLALILRRIHHYANNPKTTIMNVARKIKNRGAKN